MWQWTWSTLVYVTKSLPESMEQQTLSEPVLTDRQRCSMAFTWELFQKCPWTSSVICVRRSHFLNYYHISQGQWVKLYTSRDAYLRIHHSAYWCPGAKAPGHQYEQCWLSIDQSHRYGRHQAACREPAGSYDKTTRTAICFEHKTQYLLIRAPYTRIVVFWHISNIPPHDFAKSN